MSSAKHLALPAVAMLVVAGFWLWRGPIDAEGPPAAEAEPTAPRPGVAGSDLSRDPGGRSATPAPRAGEPTGVPEAASDRTRNERRDRAATDAMRQQLRTLRRGGSTHRDGAGAAEAGDEEATLDPEYIQARVREDLLPIAQECYESALEDDPKLGGSLTMKFAIVGDPSVGGVVDEASADPSSEITHPDLLECMRESMLSLSFPAPEDAGRVEVVYPFVFASDGPGDGQGDGAPE